MNRSSPASLPAAHAAVAAANADGDDSSSGLNDDANICTLNTSPGVDALSAAPSSRVCCDCDCAWGGGDGDGDGDGAALAATGDDSVYVALRRRSAPVRGAAVTASVEGVATLSFADLSTVQCRCENGERSN